MTTVLICNNWALGDTVCLSAAVRDLERAHPGRFRVHVAGHYTSYWRYCPYTSPESPRTATVVTPEYREGIRAANTGRYPYHFLTWFHRRISEALGVEVPVTRPHGEIHTSPRTAPVTGRYWVVVAGGKLDMTAKWWPHARWQAVVDGLRAAGVHCVQAGAHHRRDVHRPLTGCLNAVGSTDDIHDFFNLVAHSDGVLCGVTAAMHVAAVFGKPCVAVAGGREERSWEAYTNEGQWPDGCPPVAVPHTYLDVIGALDCCRDRGCWKKRTVPIEASDTQSAKGLAELCADPVREGVDATPRCMTLIHPEQVVAAVLGYERARPPSAAVAPSLLVDPPPATPNPVPREVARTDPSAPDYALMDHPTVGGRYTLFLLAHGDYFEMSKACYETLTAGVPPHRLDVRVALNQPCPATLRYFQGLAAAGAVRKLYPDSGDRRKYPAMRQMFWDADCPIETPYVIWADDDVKAANPRWLVRLTETILANHREGGRLYGNKWYHDLTRYAKNGHRPDLWFRDATWWRGENLRLSGRLAQTAPNGSVVEFVSGWFWALASEVIRLGEIPDARLNHNGGDITIGEQVHQAGYKVIQFNENKSLLWCPTKKDGGRRGYVEGFPWEPR